MPRVVVLEARKMCSGATGRNGGHLIVDVLAERKRREWETRGYADVKSVIQEMGKDMEEECEWREVRGAMAWWRWGRGDWEAAKKRVAADGLGVAEGGGLTVVEDQEDLRSMDLKGDVLGALKGDWGHAATLCPYKLICGIWEKLERDCEWDEEQGLNLQMETPVLAVESDAEGDHVVRTDRGDIRARHVFVGTNGYVSQLLEQFTGLVVPTQGQMTALKPSQEGRLLKHDYALHGLKGQTGLVEDYLVQRPWKDHGYLMHGGARQWVRGGGEGVSDDSYNVEEAVKWLQDLPQRIDVGTDEPQLELSRAWTGVMGYSKDHSPWVGAMPGRRGVWVSAGYTGHGMPNAPGCGRHVARLVAAALDGHDWRERQRVAIEKGEILEEFVLSEARLAICEHS